MNQESRECQNCKQEFVIEPEDFLFYQKIKVPPPTWCPECRLQRRLSFLNFIHLYKRKCGLCKKDFIAAYHPDSPVIVYCPECWWSDKWDSREFGQEYDFSRPFFEQFRELYERAPVIGIAIDWKGDSPYNNYVGNLKGCYLLSEADHVEDSAYGIYIFYSKGMYDSSLALNCDTCYDSMHIYKVFGGIGLRNQVTESVECLFTRDSFNCQNCFGSTNLRNKKYYFFNEPLSKEQYFEKIKQWDLGSYRTYQEVQKLAEAHWKKFPVKTQFFEFSANCTGNLVFQSKNVKDSYEVTRSEDSRYLTMIRDVKDSYDITTWGEIEHCYEGIIGRNAANVRFGILCAEGAFDTEYSVLTHRGATGNFGCVSTRSNYCILNKQYSKEEYLKLIPKIRRHMDEMPYTDARGQIYRYGELFPPEFSPHGYNESLAQNMFPLTKEKAINQGLHWFEHPKTYHKIDRQADDLPDHIKDASDEVLKEIIECKKCGYGYRIIPQELAFLRKMNLPLPRLCPLCRIKKKLDVWMAELRPIRTYCSQCKKMIEVPSLHAEEPILLCKECYQKVVVD